MIAGCLFVLSRFLFTINVAGTIFLSPRLGYQMGSGGLSGGNVNFKGMLHGRSRERNHRPIRREDWIKTYTGVLHYLIDFIGGHICDRDVTGHLVAVAAVRVGDPLAIV